MTRRFNDKDRWKAFRKLDLSLKQLYDYCWDMADAIGVYEVDYDYLRLDIGLNYTDKDFDLLIKALPDEKKIIEIAPGKFLFTDFIEVVYTQLKDGYNPHKPAFRALHKHGLEINSSLNQALLKLVNEYEYKKEKENIIKKESKKKNRGPVEIVYPFTSEKFITAWNTWLEYRREIKETYKSPKSEQAALKQISVFDEDFAIGLIERSIAGGYQGLVFENTMASYLKYKNQGAGGADSGKNMSHIDQFQRMYGTKQV